MGRVERAEIAPIAETLSRAATITVPRRRLDTFDALAVRDFRLLWSGSLVSNIGTWMQMIGQGWLVLQLTNSPFWLGLVSFASAVPAILVSLPAGVLADRVDRR